MRIILFLLLMLLCNSDLSADGNKKVPFGVNEKFKYAIKFLGITAGIGEIKIKEICKINGRKAYHIVATARAVPPFSWVHNFRDKVESWMDTEFFYSHRLVKSIKEGDYEKKEVLDFDQKNHLVKYKNGGKFKILPNTQDFLSAFYYFRTIKINVGESPSVKVHASRRNWDFKIKILRKEKIKTIFGRLKCFVVKPIMDFETVFKQRGDVTMWVTADSRLIPVYMKTNALIGLVYAKLIKATIVK